MIRDESNPCPVCGDAGFIIRTRVVARRIAWPNTLAGFRMVRVPVAASCTCPECSGQGGIARDESERLPAGSRPVRHW